MSQSNVYMNIHETFLYFWEPEMIDFLEWGLLTVQWALNELGGKKYTELLFNLYS